MDKKLEARIARLEKLLNCKSTKNESLNPVAKAVYATADTIKQAVDNLCKTLAYSDITDYRDIDLALTVCENTFSEKDNRRFNIIIEKRKNGEEYSM